MMSDYRKKKSFGERYYNETKSMRKKINFKTKKKDFLSTISMGVWIPPGAVRLRKDRNY